MFGDYEAQRHWMEVTTALPMKYWYAPDNVSGTSAERINDLQYWGLDYPPLTAYVSYACGIAAKAADPALVEPLRSRGYESPGSKAFMRFTVVFFDVLVYFAAAWIFCRFVYGNGGSDFIARTWACFKRDKRNFSFACETYLLLLLSPGIILIDHGHFQYNCVSLGLVLAALALLHRDRRLCASLAFTLSLNFKQMSLYFAPAFFFYLLSLSVWDALDATSSPFWRILRVSVSVAKLGAVVVGTFAAHWLPFCFDFSHDSWFYPEWVGRKQCAVRLGSVWTRLFAFSRGVLKTRGQRLVLPSPLIKSKRPSKHDAFIMSVGYTGGNRPNGV